MLKSLSIFFILISGVAGYIYSFNQIVYGFTKDTVFTNFSLDTEKEIEKITNEKQILFINSKNISYEVADTPEKREKGLGEKSFLPKDFGMLFVFEKPEIQTFWMKDMNFDIDIIWISKNKKIIGIEKNVSKNTYIKENEDASQKYISPEKVLYVLEIGAGNSDKFNFKVGDTVKF